MSEVCDLCRRDALEAVYQPDGGTRGIAIHICKHCGLVQSLPRADRAPRAAAAVSGGADWGNVRYGKAFRTNSCIGLLSAHADLTQPLNILDVGSNRGAFARAITEAARAATVTAVEPDERVFESAAGIARVTPVHARIEQTDFADESFDVVHSCHTIEHLASPAQVLADHWRVLKPGGLLIVDAPNLTLIGADDIVEEWFIDKHLYHYSPVTLGRTLDAAGFDIIDGPDAIDRENLLFAAIKRGVAHRPVTRDLGEFERATALVANYVLTRLRNLTALGSVAAELTRLAPRGVAVWGAGRLFDALVVHGKFNPKSLKLLVDSHLKAHVETRHGVALASPDALKEAKPEIVAVMSRAFAGEIARMAHEIVPNAEIVFYADLIGRARTQLAA